MKKDAVQAVNANGAFIQLRAKGAKAAVGQRGLPLMVWTSYILSPNIVRYFHLSIGTSIRILNHPITLD